MLVTFNGKMVSGTKGPDDICALKRCPLFDAFNLFPPRGADVFPLKTLIYAAFINKNALFMRNSLYFARILRAFPF
jgi:hypothetical protein